MAPTTGLTDRQRSAVAGLGRTHHGLAEAQHQLYAALRRPQPGREREWARDVAEKLQAARDAIAAHRLQVCGADGLYEELRLDAPWLLPRLNQLNAQLERVEREAADLATEVGRVADGDVQGLPHIRHDAERMLAMLRDLMARESDLVYERFNEPVAID